MYDYHTVKISYKKSDTKYEYCQNTTFKSYYFNILSVNIMSDTYNLPPKYHLFRLFSSFSLVATYIFHHVHC